MIKSLKLNLKGFFKNLFGETGERLKGFIKEVKGLFSEFIKTPLIKRSIDDAKRQCSVGARRSLEASRDAIRYLKIGKHEILRYGIWISLIAFVMFVLIAIALFFQVGNRWDRTSYRVVIPMGYGANQIADLLIDKRIVDGRYGFNLTVNIFNLSDKIQAGTYSFSPSMPLIQIVWKLKSGDVVPAPRVKLVIPEGSSIYNMGEIIKSRNIGKGEDFKDYASYVIPDSLKDKYPFLESLKIDSLEGYLFPDTYLVPVDVTNTSLLELMLSRFSLVVIPLWSKAKGDTKYTLHEILTLASIIEKEAAVPEERSIISSVFHNRLKRGIKLAADPTVKYALSSIRKPTKKVYYIDLEVDSPYNTYRYLGLPPGPICNPGLDSIKAAVYPAKTNYYYFVARPDGTHVFSATWREHERAKKIVRGK